MKRIFLALMTAALFTSCAGDKSKALILYYSQTGATESVAVELQKQIGADIERYDVEEVYDGDYLATIERVKGERESGFVPTLVPVKADLSQYDVIYLAYPIWFGTYAPPVKALLANVNFDGKEIVPVCTFGSGGLERSSADLAEALPNAEIEQGFGIRHARVNYVEEELNRFLIENGHKNGQIDPLPDYVAQDSLCVEDLAIYEEAVYGYPYPMGEPFAVSSRAVADGTDYIFTVSSNTPDGKKVEGKVFVSKRSDRPVEFTKVIR